MKKSLNICLEQCFLTRWMVQPRVNEFSVAKFLHAVVTVSSQHVTATTNQMVNMKRCNVMSEAVSNLTSLQKNCAMEELSMYDVIGIYYANRCHVAFTWVMESVLSDMWASCTPVRRLSARSAVLSKFHTQSRVKTRHTNSDQSSLTSWGTGVTYLWYSFVTALVLIPPSNMHLYLR